MNSATIEIERRDMDLNKVNVKESPEVKLHRMLLSNHRAFCVMICVCVLMCSFLYGLCAGLKKPVYAFSSPNNIANYNDTDAGFSLTLLDESQMPDGLSIVPMGSNATLNGQSVDLLLFSTARSVTSVVDEQVQKWKQMGYKTSGVAYDKTAGALAHDNAMQRVYVIMAWAASLDELKYLPAGHAVRGMLSAQARQGASEDVQNMIPNVPPVPGGQVKTVFASDDRSGKSYSGIYVSPNSLWQTAEFYKSLFASEGWVEQQSPNIAQSVNDAHLLEFVNGSEHVALLLSDINEKGAELVGNDARTIVNVTRYVN